MSDISPYIIISILSIAMLMVVLMAGVIFFLRKKQLQTISELEQREVEIEQLSEPTQSESSCHESAYRFLPEVVLIFNSKFKITYLNLEAEKMLDCKLRSVMGRDYRSILSLKNLKTKRTLQDVVYIDDSEKDDVVTQEYLLQTHNNQNFPVKLSLIALPSYANTGNETYSLLILKNISEMKAMESKISMLDSYDSVTGALNRRSFENEVKQLIDNTHKHDSAHIIAYFSIDQFRDIKDSIGHAGSENLNIKIMDIIHKNIRERFDIVAKVGDGEFSIIFCESKLAVSVTTIKTILKEVSEHIFTSRGQEYPVSMSAGFAIINNETTSATRVLSEANKACNVALKKGGGRLSPYRADDKEIKKLAGNFEWILILKKAIQNNLFEMYAQPIHPLSPIEYRKPFSHYELLLRLNDEKGNPISPDEFISAAEYYSMMPTLDRWVIRKSFNEISKVPKQNPIPVFAINLSGQSLNDPDFLEFILGELKSSGVDPKMLCFEITEQVAVDDITLLNKLIACLKARGSSFSLDDFGTGVSSFGYLKSLDVDYLKIDGSFVKNIANDDVARGMVQSIAQIGHTMELKIIAEYVENIEILNILSDMGIDYGQGYHIDRPGPLSIVIKRHQAIKRAINF